MAVPAEGTAVRFAAFNIWELSSAKLGRVDASGHGTHEQLRHAAEIIQRVHPDVLLVNEIDFDEPGHQNAIHFRDRYLRVSQNGQPPLDYPFVFFAPVNTGVPTGRDLDNDGKTDGPADAFGYGRYPGQYGLALYSRYPIDESAARTFQKFLWKDMPKNLMPDGSNGKPAWYSAEEVAVLRLSSKSHWDVPLKIGDTVVHVLASHPTPPVFDGPEDFNGRRNFDEVRLWADYLTGGETAAYIVDDQGRCGGLDPKALFVLLGDLNADPYQGDAPYGRRAVQQLLGHPRVQDPRPESPGAAAAIRDYAGPKGVPTASFGRADYALPCDGLSLVASGVFWPSPDDPLHALVAQRESSSDHRLVWVEVKLP